MGVIVTPIEQEEQIEEDVRIRNEIKELEDRINHYQFILEYQDEIKYLRQDRRQELLTNLSQKRLELEFLNQTIQNNEGRRANQQAEQDDIQNVVDGIYHEEDDPQL